jgi:hypothetical protein
VDCDVCGKTLDVKEPIVYLFRDDGRTGGKWRAGNRIEGGETSPGYFHKDCYRKAAEQESALPWPPESE